MEQFSNREVAEWMAFAAIEPFGEERADLRAGGWVFHKHNPAPVSPLPSSPPPRTPAPDMDAGIKHAFMKFKKQQG